VGLNGEGDGGACTKASSTFMRLSARCNDGAGAFCSSRRLMRHRRSKASKAGPFPQVSVRGTDGAWICTTEQEVEKTVDILKSS
jgi:hypothetical protein